MNRSDRRLSFILPPHFRLRTFLTCVLLLTLAVPARAMDIAPCDEPRVFDGAALNTVILPFRYTGPDRGRVLSEAAQKLAHLLQLDILFSLIKYSSIGVVELRGEPNGCHVDKVQTELLRGEGPGKLRPGHGLILLWGRLYEEGDAIYLQSYMKFLRRDQDEVLTYSPLPNSQARYIFAAAAPAQAIAFAPRRLERRDLENIIEEFSRVAIVRPEPDSTLSGEALDVRDSSRKFGYHVTHIQDEWLKIQAWDNSLSGWVQARRGASSPLNRIMPELSFLDGVAGYLRYQVGQDAGDIRGAPAHTLRHTSEAFSHYRESIGQVSEPLNMAVASGLEGMLLVRNDETGNSNRVQLDRAAALFARSRQLAPYNAGARNLDFIGQLINAANGEDQSPGLALTRSLLDTLAVDPDNRFTLANLESLYRYFQTTASINPFSANELQARLNTLEKIRGQGTPLTSP